MILLIRLKSGEISEYLRQFLSSVKKMADHIFLNPKIMSFDDDYFNCITKTCRPKKCRVK